MKIIFLDAFYGEDTLLAVKAVSALNTPLDLTATQLEFSAKIEYTDEAYYLKYNVTNGGVVIDNGPLGEASIHIKGSDLVVPASGKNSCFWDLILENGTTGVTLARGRLTMTPRVGAGV